MCYSPWGREELDSTESLNKNEAGVESYWGGLGISEEAKHCPATG